MASTCYVCLQPLPAVVAKSVVVQTRAGIVCVHPGACRYALRIIDTPDLYVQHVKGEMKL